MRVLGHVHPVVLLSLVLGLAGALLPARVAAQVDRGTRSGQGTGRDARPVWSAGGGGGALLPRAAFDEGADPSGAFEMFLSFRPRSDRPWGARLSFLFAGYAHSDTTYALPGIDAETRTSSELLFLMAGPEFVLGTGRVRGVLHAAAGLGHAATRTAIRGGTGDVGNGNATDNALAFEGGAGLSLGITPAHSVALELGGRWFSTGRLTWVPEGGIRRAAGALVLATREDDLSGIVLRGAVVARIGPRP